MIKAGYMYIHFRSLNSRQIKVIVIFACYVISIKFVMEKKKTKFGPTLCRTVNRMRTSVHTGKGYKTLI